MPALAPASVLAPDSVEFRAGLSTLSNQCRYLRLSDCDAALIPSQASLYARWIDAEEKRFGTVEAVPEGHKLDVLSDSGGAYIAHDTQRIARSLDLTPTNSPV